MKAVDHVMKLVLRYGLQQRAVFNSGDKRVIDKIYEEYGFMLEGGENHFASGSPETGKRLDAVCLHIDRVASETVQKYVDMGKLVWCWGAEELEEINKAIDCGVTLLVCDNPTTCLDIVKERGIV